MSSTPEPEWDDDERALMLALDHYRRAILCPCGCGWPAEVSQAEKTEGSVQVPPPTRCHVRTALIKAQREVERDEPEALLWGAEMPQPQKSTIRPSTT